MEIAPSLVRLCIVFIAAFVVVIAFCYGPVPIWIGDLRNGLGMQAAQGGSLDTWGLAIADHMRSFDGGISAELVNRTLTSFATPVIVQYIEGSLYLVDPSQHCVCGYKPTTSPYRFGFREQRCLALLREILVKMERSSPRLPNFEFVHELGDGFTSHPFNLPPSPRGGPFPIFHACRFWPLGGFAVPVLHSHSPLNLSTFDSRLDSYTVPERNRKPFLERRGAAVFRGFLRSCSDERNVMVTTPSKAGTSANASLCGRSLLLEVSRANPELVDYVLHDYTSLFEQSRMFRYVIHVEGNGAWSDRYAELLATGMVPFVQALGCEQWFEPLLRPFEHFIPVSHDFRDLPGSVMWANAHPAQASRIADAAVDFSRRFLRQAGIQEYLSTLLRAYAARLQYAPALRAGAIDVRSLLAEYDLHGMHTGKNSACLPL